MSNKMFLLLLVLFQPLISDAQNEPKERPYKLWLRSMDSPVVKIGYLQSLSDSSMTIHRGWYVKPREQQTFQAEQIQWVKFRKEGKVLRGVGIGAALGLTTGIIWGVALGDDPPCGPPPLYFCFSLTRFQKGMFISLISVPVGALVGGLVRSGKTKFTLDGRRSEYNRQRKLIESFRKN